MQGQTEKTTDLQSARAGKLLILEGAATWLAAGQSLPSTRGNRQRKVGDVTEPLRTHCSLAMIAIKWRATRTFHTGINQYYT